MNEAFRILLRTEDGPLGPTKLDSGGLTMDGESSASARGFTLGLEPDSPVTEFRLRRVRQIHDWGSRGFRINISLSDGAVLCQGVDSQSLPAGRYRLRAMISDLVPVDQPIRFEIPEGGIAEVPVLFRPDPRRFELVTPLSGFDGRIRAVLSSGDTRFDGMGVEEWFQSRQVRGRRKACLLNVLAKMRLAPDPTPGIRLIDHVSSLFFADVDRVYAVTTGNLVGSLDKLAADPKKPFYFEGTPKAAIHRNLLTLSGEAEPFEYTLLSYRQEGRPSLQLVAALPPKDIAEGKFYADLDIDLGNPLQDFEGALIHFGEVLTPGKTDHLKLWEKFRKGATSDFMYYRVTTSRQ